MTTPTMTPSVQIIHFAYGPGGPLGPTGPMDVSGEVRLQRLTADLWAVSLQYDGQLNVRQELVDDDHVDELVASWTGARRRIRR